MKIVHICDGWEKWNGAANVARLIAGEQKAAEHEVMLKRWMSVGELRSADEVWLHCGWKPCLWWGALWGRNVKWMSAGCYDPMRLRFHAWKKRPVGFIERFFLRRCRALVATCEAEGEWIRAYLGKRCPPVEVQDIRRFFAPPRRCDIVPHPTEGRPLHVLYLGRRHPLKGVKYLELAVDRLNYWALTFLPNCPKDGVVEHRCVSDHYGDELERDWAWCDVLCLPTLSDNLGLVVAEALERGKAVITTDGAPAWDRMNDDSLFYLRGYRDGTDAERVSLLTEALKRFV